jgi:hypothetical protein
MSYVLAIQKNNQLSFEHHNNYESRGISVERLITQAVSHFNLTKDFSFRVWTGDHPNTDYSFCTTTKDWKTTFPCFTFDSWPECGLSSYTGVISSFKDTLPSTEKIGWIGAPLNSIRSDFVQNFQDSPYIEPLVNNWNRVDPNNLWKNTNTFLSYQDQVDRWKFLIDIEGLGWSARLKVLLNTPRIVFIVDRPYEEHFFQYLEPWVTHVPIKRDFSDLIENYKIIQNDESLQKFILQKKKEFCDNHLQHIHALERIKEIIDDI